MLLLKIVELHLQSRGYEPHLPDKEESEARLLDDLLERVEAAHGAAAIDAARSTPPLGGAIAPTDAGPRAAGASAYKSDDDIG